MKRRQWEKQWDKLPKDFPRNGQLRIYRINEVIAEFVDRIGGTVLDIGCATGLTYESIKKINVKYTGIDFTKHLVEKAKEINPEMNVQYMDAKNMTFPDKSFDTVFCKSVLEHQYPNEYPIIVREMARVAKKQVLIAFFKPPIYGREVIEVRDGLYTNRYNLEKFIELIEGLDRFESYQFMEDVNPPEDTLYIINLKR